MPRVGSPVSWGLLGQGTATPPRQAELPSLSWRPSSGLSVKMNVWEGERRVKTGLGQGQTGGQPTAQPPMNPHPGGYTHSRPLSPFSDRHKPLSASHTALGQHEFLSDPSMQHIPTQPSFSRHTASQNTPAHRSLSPQAPYRPAPPGTLPSYVIRLAESHPHTIPLGSSTIT